MTSKLEKQFFDTFGIKKELNTCEIGRYGKCTYSEPCVSTCPNFKSIGLYPEITDTQYLELICILNSVIIPDIDELYREKLQVAILQECINALTKVDWKNRIPTKEEFINEIQELFSEVQNDR